MKSFLQYLHEAQEKTAVFTFGRFQPPTIGHEKLLRAVEMHARGANFFIYSSQTVDKKDNLLPWKEKIDLLKKMFPHFSSHIITDSSIKTFLEAATALGKQGYTHLIMVVGDDRLSKFQDLLNKYNGNLYDFESIEVVSAGARDPDADDESGASASKARQAAREGDLKAFTKLMPKNLPQEDIEHVFKLFANR